MVFTGFCRAKSVCRTSLATWKLAQQPGRIAGGPWRSRDVMNLMNQWMTHGQKTSSFSHLLWGPWDLGAWPRSSTYWAWATLAMSIPWGPWTILKLQFGKTGFPSLPNVLCLQNTYWLKHAMHIFLVCCDFFFRGLGELTWGSSRRLLAPDANWLFQPQIIHFLFGTKKNLTQAQIIHVRHPFFVKGNLWQLCDLHLASEERISAERLQCLQWAGIWNITTTRLPGHGTQVHYSIYIIYIYIYTYVHMVCQKLKLRQNSVSGWGSLEVK